MRRRCSYLRELCYHVVCQNSTKHGGSSKIIDVDDAEIGHRECNCVRLVDGNWMFGGMKLGSQKCVLLPLSTRGSKTLLYVIKECILPGIVISNCLKSYSCPQGLGFLHLIVDHKYNLFNIIQVRIQKMLVDCGGKCSQQYLDMAVVNIIYMDPWLNLSFRPFNTRLSHIYCYC